jgi:type I restriction enzyme S subunit
MRPTDDLVSEFEKMCEPLDERIRQNVIENEKLRQLRDTLLPRLISGEVQIKDAEIGAGEAA